MTDQFLKRHSTLLAILCIVLLLATAALSVLYCLHASAANQQIKLQDNRHQSFVLASVAAHNKTILTNEELKLTNKELKLTNEELQARNDALQLRNEELWAEIDLVEDLTEVLFYYLEITYGDDMYVEFLPWLRQYDLEFYLRLAAFVEDI